ncbi:MAG: hypothetical protein HOE69_00860 [Euryarchaeota archaeon]|jgi:succinate dehydrogenase/fumarate reductase cytochrome b subunit|nr:hypothetical protein [Euryarchaeota archaeon]
MAAGRGRKSFKRTITQPFVDFWESKRDYHLTILGMLTVLTFALIFWAIAFFTIFSSNAQQEANNFASYTAVTWVGVLLSFILLLFVMPEFFHYLGVRNSLVEMLETDSRAELQRNKKDLDEGVKLLAGAWPARLESKRVELGMRREMPEGMKLPAGEGEAILGGWFTTKNSRYAERFPDSNLFKDPGINKILIAFTSIGFVTFLYNALFGLARETIDSSRNMTVDFTAIAKGAQYNATWAPHVDLIGGMLIIGFGILLFMTTPAPDHSKDAKSDVIETEEE